MLRYVLPAILAGAAAIFVVVWYAGQMAHPVQVGVGSQPPGSTKLEFARLDRPRPVPALHFIDGERRKLTLAGFRGRTVLLNLWATWCIPCRREMPTLDRLQAKLGGPGFAVVPLSIDRRGLAAVEPFYRQLGLKALGIYVDPSGEAADTVGAVGIPTTLLIDDEGRETAREVGPAAWDSAQAVAVIRRYLAAPNGAAVPATK